MSTPLVSARAVRGELSLRAERDATGRTVLAHRHAAGAFHLSKPYWDGHALMVQWINPTAGIFAGDVLESDVSVGEGASLLLTTPSATRIHTRVHACTPPGVQRQHFFVSRGGFLEVQPEWLIPQWGSAFAQHTQIDLHEDSSLLYVELIAPGRLAHNEALQFDSLRMSLQLRLGSKLVSQEQFYVDQIRRWKMSDASGNPCFVASALIRQARVVERLIRKPFDGLGCDMGLGVMSEGVCCLRFVSSEGKAIKKALVDLRSLFAESETAMHQRLRKL